MKLFSCVLFDLNVYVYVHFFEDINKGWSPDFRSCLCISIDIFKIPYEAKGIY